jgi:hypothetical protein
MTIFASRYSNYHPTNHLATREESGLAKAGSSVITWDVFFDQLSEKQQQRSAQPESSDPNISAAIIYKMNDLRGNRTPNLRVWNPTRCHCAMKSFFVQSGHRAILSSKACLVCIKGRYLGNIYLGCLLNPYSVWSMDKGPLCHLSYIPDTQPDWVQQTNT